MLFLKARRRLRHDIGNRRLLLLIKDRSVILTLSNCQILNIVSIFCQKERCDSFFFIIIITARKLTF